MIKDLIKTNVLQTYRKYFLFKFSMTIIKNSANVREVIAISIKREKKTFCLYGRKNVFHSQMNCYEFYKIIILFEIQKKS